MLIIQDYFERVRSFKTIRSGVLFRYIAKGGVVCGMIFAGMFCVASQVYGKMIVATPQSASFAECLEERPAVTLSFGDEGFSMPDGSEIGYVFFVPRDEISSNLVYCADMDRDGDLDNGCDWKVGYPVYAGETETEFIDMAFLDGSRQGLMMIYDIIVRTAEDFDAGTLVTDWSSRGISFVVTNVVPSVTSVRMSGKSLNVNGGDMGTVTFGATKQFTATTDDSSKVDIFANEENNYTDHDNAFTTEWTFNYGYGVQDRKYVYGPPSKGVDYTFTQPGTCTITVRMRDKDMNHNRGEWGSEFTFTVSVLPKPSIVIEPRYDTIYSEDSSASQSQIDVSLTSWPVDPVSVKLTIERAGPDNGNYPLPTLSTTELTFGGPDAAATKSFYLRDLDGTSMTADYGFVIRAAVTNTTLNADLMPWKDVYRQAELPIWVENLAPEIITQPTANTIMVPINTPVTIDYAFKDFGNGDMFEPAMETLYWMISDGDSVRENVTPGANTYRGTFTTKFTSAGMKRVQLYVMDKDGGCSDVAVWYYQVMTPLEVANNMGSGTVEVYAEGLFDGIEVASGVTVVVKGEDLVAADLASKISPKPHEEGQSASFFKVKAESVPGGVSLAVVLDEDVVKPDETAGEIVDGENLAAFNSAADGESVAVSLPSAKPGLYYGIVAANDLAGLDAAAENVSLERVGDGGATISVAKPTGAAAFFKVIVSDRAH